MKTERYIKFAIAALGLLLLVGCGDDRQENVEPAVETTRVKEITYTSAVCAGRVDGSVVEWGIRYAETEAELATSATVVKASEKRFECPISNLTAGTTYYVCAYAKTKGMILYGQTKSFTTARSGEPIVSLRGVTDVEYENAAFSAMILTSGGQPITECGFCYDTAQNPTTESNVLKPETKQLGEFSMPVAGLQCNTTYYVCAYVKTADKTIYTAQSSFKTLDYPLTTATVSAVTDIEYTSLKVACNVTCNNITPITERGILYNTVDDSATATRVAATEAGEGDFTIEMTGLTSGREYYFWAYGVNRKGTGISDAYAVMTRSNIPGVSTAAIDDETKTAIWSFSAKGGLTVLNDGDGSAVTAAGLCWSTSENPTLSDSSVAVATPAVETFSDLNIGLLKPGTTYYIRAYATNANGTGYGNQVSITTRGSYIDDYVDAPATGSPASGKYNVIMCMTDATRLTAANAKSDFQSLFETTFSASLAAYNADKGTDVRLYRCCFQFNRTTVGETIMKVNLYVYTTPNNTTAYSYLYKNIKYTLNADGSLTFSNPSSLKGSTAATNPSGVKLTTVYNALDDDAKANIAKLFDFMTDDDIIIEYHPEAVYNADPTKSSGAYNTTNMALGHMRICHKNKPEEFFGGYSSTLSGGYVATW